MPRFRLRLGGLAAVIGLALLLVGCATPLVSAPLAPTATASTHATVQTTYQPQVRAFTVTAVPLLVHEEKGSMDYLPKDFVKGGLLDGKEVYGFYPSTLAVYQGDRVELTLVNPEDDSHTFTLTGVDLSVQMNAQSATKTSFVMTKAGIYPFVCAEPEHAPYMWGQLIVLPGPQTL